MIKYKNKKVIEVNEWDKLVKETYGRPYSFQQQDGCKERGTFDLTIPSEETYDEEMNDSIPEIINGEVMGVKFEKWLERDPNQPVGKEKESWMIGLFWQRNFYPDVNTLANDLYKKGLIEAGNYTIDIDW
jgi:hypothetical protein